LPHLYYTSCKEIESALNEMEKKKARIYTGTGDRGMTSLFSGERVPKSFERVDAYGDVDELNSVLGALVGALPEQISEVGEAIKQIQSDLLHIGAWLATTPQSPSSASLLEITDEQITQLEAAIDRLEGKLPTLGSFIIPGGHTSSAWAHVARTVCRRAERHVVRLILDAPDAHTESLRGVIVFLNRLSDYLFVLARYCNLVMGVPDTLWNK
jgi:cob(I)alamin adenosyltransferase